MQNLIEKLALNYHPILHELITKITANIGEKPEKIVFVDEGRVIKENKIPNSEVDVLLAGSYYHRLIIILLLLFLIIVNYF